MLYADGELDAERREAVRAHLAVSPAARRKLHALDLAGSLVREQAACTAPKGDGIADLVMARIEAERAAPPPAPPPLAPLAAPPPPAARVVRLRPRIAFAAAAVVVAAAAAVTLWIQGSFSERPRLARRDVATSVTSSHAAPGTARAATSAAELTRAEADSEHGVVVSAVDFGSRLGAIFYVPTESAQSSATTTVVWLADDPAEGDE
jgi:anti-sigma factor RsiW